MGIQERRAREFERREQEILAAALRLLGRDEWQSVTIEEIAHAAEIGKGTIYKHFASKEEIYGRLANQFSLRLLAELRTVDPQLDVLSRIKEVIRIVWRQHLELGPEYQRVVQYCERSDFIRRLGPELIGETEEIVRSFHSLINPILVEGMEKGVLGRRPPQLLHFGAQATLIGAVRMMWNGEFGGLDPDVCLEEVTRFILAGLTSETAVEKM